MDIKNIAAGVLLAFGTSNLLEVLGYGFAIPTDLVMVAGMPIGTFVVALLALGGAFYLVKSK